MIADILFVRNDKFNNNYYNINGVWLKYKQNLN
jgi:hypothetical protein